MKPFFLSLLSLLIILKVNAQGQDVLYFQAKDPTSSIFMTPSAIDNTEKGIVPLILAKISKALKIKIIYYHVPSGRVEKLLTNGQLDGSLMNKEWLVKPKNFIFSRPFLNYQVYLYSKKPFAKQASNLEILTDKSICTHRSYRYAEYPLLQQLFIQKKATRIDSADERAMLQMLLKNRCDIALIDEFTTPWLLNSVEFKGAQVFKSAFPIISIELTMAFSKKWHFFVEQLNSHISQLIASGEMNKLLQKAQLTH
jgi:polar amino acid transport system substrate-binding protein